MAKGLKHALPCPPGCYYQGYRGSGCDYYFLTGQRLGRKEGQPCDKFLPKDGQQRDKSLPPRPQHEVEGYTRRPTAVRALEADPKASAMWEAGASDKEIGAATGWSPSSVRKWRHQTGRESRYGQ